MIENKINLNHQYLRPKIEIAEILDQHGIPSPRRYNTYAEAKNALPSRTSIIHRSEHPHDFVPDTGYAAPSGLYESPVDYRGLNEDEKHNQLELTYRTNNIHAASRYADTLRLDQIAISDQLSFSHWEYLAPLDESSMTGLSRANIIMQADQSRPGCLHIIASRIDIWSNSRLADYYTHDFDEEPEQTHGILSPSSRIALARLYTSILPHLSDPDHMPLVEAQLEETEGQEPKANFLQLAIGHSRSPSRPTLDKRDFPDKEGWIPALWVRGASPNSDEIRLSAAVSERTDLPLEKHTETAAIDPGSSLTTDLLSKRRAHLIPTRLTRTKTPNDVAKEIAYWKSSNHGNSLHLLKPPISIIYDKEKLPPTKQLEARAADKDNGLLDLDLVSDGHNAYFRIVDL